MLINTLTQVIGSILEENLLLDLAKPQNGETVLDLGCGTGQLTSELAYSVGPTGKVIAIDPDVERLKVAQASIPPEIKTSMFRQYIF